MRYPRRQSVEYRWRWVFWRWPCRFHVDFTLFVHLFPRWQRENQPTQRQIPVEYRLNNLINYFVVIPERNNFLFLVWQIKKNPVSSDECLPLCGKRRNNQVLKKKYCASFLLQGVGPPVANAGSQIIIQPPPPKAMRNKALLCKPFTQTKATSCRPHTTTRETQTGQSQDVLFFPTL